MSDVLNSILQIRYTSLKFTIRFPYACSLPDFKSTIIRGGIIELMCRNICVRDYRCELCDFRGDCVVSRMLKPNYKRQPILIKRPETPGFIIDCENYFQEFEAGSRLQFSMTLFGSNIADVKQYLQSVFALGQMGMGKDAVIFDVEDIQNTEDASILDQGKIVMKKILVERLQTYVDLRRIQSEYHFEQMTFLSPVTLQQNGRYLAEFDLDVILKSVKRRLYLLGCMEGIEDDAFNRVAFQAPDIEEQIVNPVSIRRNSRRRGSGMYLRGITGEIYMEPVMTKEIEELLMMGEVIHVGRNTEFGFGRYWLS